MAGFRAEHRSEQGKMSEYMNPPETEQEKICGQHRAELSGSIYAILSLVVTTFGLDRAFAVYLDLLLYANQISRWTLFVQHLERGMAVVFLGELIIVLCCYRLGRLRMWLR